MAWTGRLWNALSGAMPPDESAPAAQGDADADDHADVLDGDNGSPEFALAASTDPDEQLRAAGVPVARAGSVGEAFEGATLDGVTVAPGVAEGAAVVTADERGVRETESAVEELRAGLAELQSMVARLAQRSERADVEDPARRIVTPEPGGSELIGSDPGGSDPDVAAASRTLRLAELTAEQVVSEAGREADAIIADADRQRTEIIRRSRHQAELEFANERERVRRAESAWEEERAVLIAELERLEGSVGDYRRGLSGVADSLTSCLGILRASARSTEHEPVLSPTVDLTTPRPDPVDTPTAADSDAS